MKPRVDWWEVLDVFCWGIEFLGRPSVGRALRGYDEARYRSLDDRFWRRLEEQQWVVRRGKGSRARFAITAKGKAQCTTLDPRDGWEQLWDRKWRLLTFDVPEVRSKDRVALWRELRSQRFGLLQRSVWIWPRAMEGILNQIIHASGIPECFAGFECSRIFLCTDEEIVRTAWDFASIRQSHDGYLKQADSLLSTLQDSKTIASMARAARNERLAYEAAMEHDPCLPLVLWPKRYVGPEVWERHATFRSALEHRFRSLVSSAPDTEM